MNTKQNYYLTVLISVYLPTYAYICLCWFLFKKDIKANPMKCEKEKRGGYFFFFSFFKLQWKSHAQTVLLLNYSSIKFYVLYNLYNQHLSQHIEHPHHLRRFSKSLYCPHPRNNHCSNFFHHGLISPILEHHIMKSLSMFSFVSDLVCSPLQLCSYSFLLVGSISFFE